MNFSFELIHEVEDKFIDEVDVIVLLNDESKYHVTFVTYQKANEYFKDKSLSIFSNTLFVEKLSEKTISESLDYVINNGIYISVFYPINTISVEKLNDNFDLEREIDLESE